MLSGLWERTDLAQICIALLGSPATSGAYILTYMWIRDSPKDVIFWKQFNFIDVNGSEGKVYYFGKIKVAWASYFALLMETLGG